MSLRIFSILIYIAIICTKYREIILCANKLLFRFGNFINISSIYFNYWYFRLFNNNLNGLTEFLNTIPNINNGGCGLSAYILYCYNDFKGNVYGYHDNNIKNNKVIGNNISCLHVFYKYNNNFYDSNGVHSKKQVLYGREPRKRTLFKYDTKTLYKSVMDEQIWNSAFEHRKILLKLFKKYFVHSIY